MLVALAALVAGASPAESGPAARNASTVDVTYTKQTVDVPAALVTSTLADVSADGSTYTFKKAVGPLLSLAPGKVMLLEGKAIADVTSVSHAGGKLIVHGREPAITDLIQSGTIDVSSPVDFSKGTLVGEQHKAPDVKVEGTRNSVGLGAANSNSRGTSEISGTTGGVSYEANLDSLQHTLSFKISNSFEKKGLITKVALSGIMDKFDAHMRMLVQDHDLVTASFFAEPFNGHLHLDWSFGRGDNPDTTIKIPAFTLPFSYDLPFVVGGIPFFVKIQFELLVNVSMSARNATLQGAVDIDYDGSGGGGLSGSNAISVEGSPSATATVDTTLQSITLSSSGAIVAVAAPKVVFGIGFPGVLNGTGYVDLIASVGQTTGAAIAGQVCSKYDVYLTVKAGLGAQIFGAVNKSQDLASKDLFDKHITQAQPGC